MIDIIKQLIRIPSTADNTEALREALEIFERELKDYTIERFEKNSCPSILVYAGDARPERFRIILNGHIDVVPGLRPQYVPKIEDQRLYGRGAYDMKAAAVVEMLVFKELAHTLDYPLGLQIVTDEETGGLNGTKHQCDNGVQADFVIAGEPTDLDINYMSKGVIWARLHTEGRAAHGAYPWQGKNAIMVMKDVLKDIDKAFPVPNKAAWQTTITVSGISTSNTATNKVPDDCTAVLDIRFTPEDQVKQRLEHIVDNRAHIEYLLEQPAHHAPKDNAYIRKLKQAAGTKLIRKHGSSDVRFFDCPAVTFGPKGEGLHTDNEWVDIASLKRYKRVLEVFLRP